MIDLPENVRKVIAYGVPEGSEREIVAWVLSIAHLAYAEGVKAERERAARVCDAKVDW